MKEIIKYITEKGKEYCKWEDGSWTVSDGITPIEELGPSVYVSSEKFRELYDFYQSNKSKLLQGGIERLIEEGKKENYEKEGGRIFSIVIDPNTKKPIGIRWSSKVVKIRIIFAAG